MSTTTSTLQTTYSRYQHNQRTEQNDLTLPTDRNWPITTDERYLSLTANNITAKLTNQFPPTRLIPFDWQTTLSLDSDDDFRSGCRNVSHCHRQQSFSGLPSPGRSHYTIDCHSRVQTLYWIIVLVDKFCLIPIHPFLTDFGLINLGFWYYLMLWFDSKSISNCIHFMNIVNLTKLQT